MVPRKPAATSPGTPIGFTVGYGFRPRLTPPDGVMYGDWVPLFCAYELHCAEAALLALRKFAACTRPTHRVPRPVPKHEQLKIDCGTGTIPPATTTGAGASVGSALVVDKAAGAPGTAAAGPAAGIANGARLLTDEFVDPPEESGVVTEGINGVPAAMLLCARAGELSASAPSPKPTNAITAISQPGCRSIRPSTY